MRRNSRWPWNPMAPAPAVAFGGQTDTYRRTCQLAWLQGRALPRHTAEVCSGLSPGSPWQTLDSRTFPLIGPPFNKIKRQRELTVLPCLLFTSGPHCLGTSVPPGLSLVCKIQQSQMCRAVGWRTEETEAHKIQFLNFSRFCCFLPSLFQCALSTLNALRAFQHRGQSPRSPCHKKYFLCHFPVSHTPGRKTRSRDEARPYKAQGRSMYNYFISIQQAIQHFISNL